MRRTPVRIIRYAGMAALVVVFYWFASFTETFELFGYPVHDRSRGWLGPTPRDRRCVVDIGKIHDWTCEDRTIFERHWVGCRVWLRLNGLRAV